MWLFEGKNDIKFGCLMLYLNPAGWDSFLSIIKPEDINEEVGGLETEPHVTVLYGFHEETSPNAVINSIKDTLQYVDCLEVKDISIFENENFDVVKLDVSNPFLNKANSIVTSLFPHTNKFPEYHAHITIAYCKKGTGKKYCMELKEKFKLNSVKLVFSNAKKEKTTLEIPTKKRCAGVAFICNKKILLVKEQNGSYSLPKGGIEINEKPYECAIREIKEETTIDISNELKDTAGSHSVYTGIGVFECFIIRDNEERSLKNFTPNKEILEIKYVPIESAISLLPSWQVYPLLRFI